MAAEQYRLLAVRVISLALRDLLNPGGLAADRHSACLFLAGSRMLTHWCAVAGLDPKHVVISTAGLRTSAVYRPAPSADRASFRTEF
jgi:hypothetical protein